MVTGSMFQLNMQISEGILYFRCLRGHILLEASFILDLIRQIAKVSYIKYHLGLLALKTWLRS